MKNKFYAFVRKETRHEAREKRMREKPRGPRSPVTQRSRESTLLTRDWWVEAPCGGVVACEGMGVGVAGVYVGVCGCRGGRVPACVWVGCLFESVGVGEPACKWVGVACLLGW